MQRPEPLAAIRGPDLRAHERTQRVTQAAEWLLDGMRPRDVVTKGCATWGVGKRMAQLYVATARKQLHGDALQQSHLFAQELAQHQRLKVFHESRAVVNDPQTSDARRRAQISFFGKVTRLFADYEKSAQHADEMHASEKFMPRPLQPMDLQVEFDRLRGESDVVDKWVDQAERVAGAAEQGTGNLPVASSAGSTTTTATASASTQETPATAQPDCAASPQPHDHEHLAEDQADCAHFADCALNADDPAPEAPPEFNPTTCQEIVASVQRGARLPVAAAAAGISRESLRHWLKSDGDAFKDFRQQVRQGKGQARLQAERTVHKKDARYWLSRGPGGWRDVDKSPDQSNEDQREEFNELQAFVLEYLHGQPAAKADLAQKLLEWHAKKRSRSREC